MSKFPVLETERMILRPAAMGLSRAALDFYRRNLENLQPVEPQHEEDFLTLRVQKEMMRHDVRMARKLEGVRYWMFPKDDPGRAIGCVCLSSIVYGAFRSCFLAYKVDKDLRRQGYAKEAVLAAVEVAFRGLDLHRIEANIMPRNRASLALARSCGFREEGLSPRYLQICGVWEDHVHMVLLNEEEQ